MTTHGVPVWWIRHSLLHKETKNRKILIVDAFQFKVVVYVVAVVMERSKADNLAIRYKNNNGVLRY